MDTLHIYLVGVLMAMLTGWLTWLHSQVADHKDEYAKQCAADAEIRGQQLEVGRQLNESVRELRTSVVELGKQTVRLEERTKEI
jgi:hypothetical protein